MPQTTDTAPADPFAGIFDADGAATNPDVVRSRRNLPVAIAIEAAQQTARYADQLAADTDGAREHTEPVPAGVTSRHLEQADVEITAADERAIRLRIERRRLADRFNPTADGVPLDAVETYREQYAAAAFLLAYDAMKAALDASQGRARTVFALRTLLDMLADEVDE